MTRHVITAVVLVLLMSTVGSAQSKTTRSRQSKVAVPNVVGKQLDAATKELESLNLRVSQVIERELKLPDRQVIRQQPEAGTEVNGGSGVVLMVAKNTAASEQKPTPQKVQPPEPSLILKREMLDMPARALVTLFKDAGLETEVVMKKSEKSRGSVLAVLQNGKELAADDAISLDSEIVLHISSGSNDAPPSDSQPPPSGSSPAIKRYTTEPIIMTGIRYETQQIETQPIIMTGIRFQLQQINTEAIIMTGIRYKPQRVLTEPIIMTGIRNN